jgi:hypothetical protein
LRNSSLVLIALLSSRLLAQTSRVPFVGCESIGQGKPVPAPKGIDPVLRIGAFAAQNLAYYKEDFRGTGVLGPRGWHCIGFYGSSGSDLLVAPQTVGLQDFSQNHQRAGPAIELQYISAENGSGRVDMAQIFARVFPAQRTFVKDVRDLFDFPASDFPFGPFPNDRLILQTDRIVEYETPPHSDGLGSMNTRLKAGDGPIDGIAILEGKATDLLMLRVRLPDEQRDLAHAIIQELLLRQRRNPR